jgi:hypothetical protein
MGLCSTKYFEFGFGFLRFIINTFEGMQVLVFFTKILHYLLLQSVYGYPTIRSVKYAYYFTHLS